MKIVFAADLHVSKYHLPSLLETSAREKVDSIIIGGDLVPREGFATHLKGKIRDQREYLEREFIPAIEGFRGNFPEVKIYLDMGNDDFEANRDVLKAREGNLFHLLHMAKHPLTDEVDILGYMCVPPTPFSLKDWEKPDLREAPVTSNFVETSGIFTANEIRFGEIDLSSDDTIEMDMMMLSKMVEKPFIFISHSPPYATDLDLLHDGVTHVGSRAVRGFIETFAEKGSLIASFHGHIHESAEVSTSNCWKAGDIPCFNPGQAFDDLRYVIFQLPEE